MSYFDDFFNIERQRTLRGYTRLLDLRPFDRYAWLTSEAGVERVAQRLYSLKVIPLLTSQSILALTPVDERSFQAGTLGLIIDEVYKVKSPLDTLTKSSPACFTFMPLMTQPDT